MIELSELLNALVLNWEVVVLFFLVAVLYSSVGFGGGSSYLAILALTGLSYMQFRAIALMCNIVVVSGGTYIFAKNGHYNWSKVIPLTLLSVPLAFLGGYIEIGKTTFFIILGLVLLVAAILMWLSKFILSQAKTSTSIRSKLMDGGTGGAIGFLSGMVGIGGGIFLAPILHLTNWDTPKRIAAAASKAANKAQPSSGGDVLKGDLCARRSVHIQAPQPLPAHEQIRQPILIDVSRKTTHGCHFRCTKNSS